MKRMNRFLYLLMIALCVVALFNTTASASTLLYPSPADAGFFGGDNDYSFDPPSWNDSSSGDYSYTGGGSSGGGIPIPFPVVIIVIILFFVLSRKKKGSSSAPTSVAAIPPAQSAAVADQIRQIDPFFTEAEMREKVSNLYSEMQRANKCRGHSAGAIGGRGGSDPPNRSVFHRSGDARKGVESVF